MKLVQIIQDYVDLKQAIGSRFHAEAVIFKAFARSVGDLTMPEVTAEHVNAYLAGHGSVTRFWHRKHSALQGLYRFAIGRGYVSRSPLPATTPKLQVLFTPYIYSPEELKRLLQAVDACEYPRAKREPATVRTLLLLLYGAALRISEALALTVADVDIAAHLLTIHTSKFYKTRWVPIGPRLSAALAVYAQARPHTPLLHRPEAPFLLTRTGEPVTRQQAERVFRRVCAQAAVFRHDSPRYQPRLHDLRHTWAVHRLVAWYEEGADVQRLLAHLATYLGHVHIAATQCYLTMTPALLQAASLRFAQYAQLEVPHG
jgi:integrase/recombinase XerD